ncbi:MAG: hypothetical protein JO163_01440 [Methylobacteriaceae bacterium]|nr:hypothetical protein [Methylobacteriaceae bacterium]MBV9701368.1 hypothetical protein [Methylobacteriaceae bacterium]
MTQDERAAFLAGIFGTAVEPFLARGASRVDGRFRKLLFEAARAGDGVDQRETVETRAPLAVVNGADDRIFALDYFDCVPLGRPVSSSFRDAVGGHPGPPQPWSYLS